MRLTTEQYNDLAQILMSGAGQGMQASLIAEREVLVRNLVAARGEEIPRLQGALSFLDELLTAFSKSPELRKPKQHGHSI